MSSNCIKKFLTRKRRKRPKTGGQGSHHRQESDHGVDAYGAKQHQMIDKCEHETSHEKDLEKVSLDSAFSNQADGTNYADNIVAGDNTTCETHIKHETFLLKPATMDHSYHDLILSPLDGTESVESGPSPSYHSQQHSQQQEQQQQLEQLLEMKDGTIQHLSEDLRQTRMELFQTRKELQASRQQSHKLKERAFAIHQKFLRWDKLLQEWMARNRGKPMKEWEPTPGFDNFTTTPSSAIQAQVNVKATVDTAVQQILPLVRVAHGSDAVCSTKTNLMSAPRTIKTEDIQQRGNSVSDQRKSKVGWAQSLTGQQHITVSSVEGVSNPYTSAEMIHERMHQEKAQALSTTIDHVTSSLPGEILKLQPVTQSVIDVDCRPIGGQPVQNTSHKESVQGRGKDKNVRVSEHVSILEDLKYRAAESKNSLNKDIIFNAIASEEEEALQCKASSRQKMACSFVKNEVDKTSSTSTEGNKENIEANLLNPRRVSMTPKSNPVVPFSQNSCSTEGSLTQLDPPHAQNTTEPYETTKSRVLPQKRLFTSVSAVNAECDIKAKHTDDEQNELSGDSPSFHEWATSQALLERQLSENGDKIVQRSPVQEQHATIVCIQPASVPAKSFADTSCHSVARSTNGWKSNVMARKFVDDALGPPPAKKPAVEDNPIQVEKKVDECVYSVSRSINAWRSNVMAREFVDEPLNSPREKQTVPDKKLVTHEKNFNPYKRPVKNEKPLKETGMEPKTTTKTDAAATYKFSSSTWLNAKAAPTSMTKNTMESQVDYKHVEVVRGKKKRECLPGHSCPGCDPFWSAVCDGNDVFDRKQFQDCSRHRAAHSPENTPPNFWDLSFRDEVLAREECRTKSFAPTADDTTEI